MKQKRIFAMEKKDTNKRKTVQNKMMLKDKGSYSPFRNKIPNEYFMLFSYKYFTISSQIFCVVLCDKECSSW